jgi:3-polyprenyl-4-hydroxybenzoate decarboxylase
MGRVRVDAFAVAASVLATVMAIVYFSVSQEQGGEPAPWAVAALFGGAAAAAYGAVQTVPYGRSALVLAGLTLFALGVLAMLTIGVPILLAGILSLAAAVRRREVQAL